MKPFAKRFCVASTFAVVIYWATYFATVRAVPREYKDAVMINPKYGSLDSHWIGALFTPAYLLDAGWLRPSMWEPRNPRRTPRAAGA